MSKIVLRDYQKEAIMQIEGSIALGSEEVCLDACTSFGKTLTAAQFIKDEVEMGKKVVFMMNLTILVEQTMKALKSMGIPFRVVAAEFDGMEFDHQAPVTIAMQQTLYARIDKVDIPCDVLMIDEFHISFRTKTMEQVKDKLQPETIVGLSGTPYDAQGYAFPNVDMVQTIGIKELTEQEHLTPMKTYTVAFAEEVDLTDGGGGEYSEGFLQGKVNTPEHIAGVVTAWKQVASDRKTIAFCSSIAHSEALASHFRKHDIKAYAFHSELSKKDSKAIMDDYRNNKIQVLCSMNKVLVGFDMPDITCGIGARPTKTRRVWQQATGRLIRLFEGKDDTILLDCAQWTSEHGFYDEPYHAPTKGDRKALQKAKDEVAVKVTQALLNGEEPTEMTRKMVFDKVEELHKKSLNVPQLDLNDLISLYETTTDIAKIAEIAYEMNRRKTRQPYTLASVEWTIKPWYKMFEDFPEYRDRLVKTLRTMFKNKVIKGKKLNALHYTALEDGWLREQSPYKFKQEMKMGEVDFDIADDEIPF